MNAQNTTKGSRHMQAREIRNTKAWALQIRYWRTHLDTFIMDYLGCKLKDTQRVVARQFGNCENLMVVKSRGYGKTWLVA